MPQFLRATALEAQLMGNRRLGSDDDPPLAPYMQAGALVSLLSCATIVVSYLRRRRWRRHPNALLYWKAMVDMIYALRLQYAWDQLVGRGGCSALVALTQFCMTASECWFLSMAVDLYRCSTNPFINIQQSLRWYHAFAWGTGASVATLTFIFSRDSDDDEAGQSRTCFVTDAETKLQLFYYVVVIISLLVAVALATLGKQSYPHGGMAEALQAKRDVIRNAQIFTMAYIMYQVAVLLLWVANLVVVSAKLDERQLAAIRNFSAFFQTAKGFIDLIIWISMNGTPCCATRLMPPTTTSARYDRNSDVDIDLQPQLNRALRKEVLHFTARGVVAASTNALHVSESRQRVVRLRLHELGMTVHFHDYYPRVFREIRRGFGIVESKYRQSFLATCHERIQSGGSSGAFMFFTADYMYLVKTVTISDRDVLLRMLPSYISHLRANPGSHLTRYYGAHSVEMYGKVFSFVVMGNVIGRASMHQFYDIKGSWINRNAKPIPPGKMVICTYCSNAFKYGSTQHCQYSIQGTHLPRTVLKDNDFHHTLRLLPQTAEEIVQQLDIDTAFLCAEGITDYSLLISVHNTKYTVDHDAVDVTNFDVPSKRRVHYAVRHRDGESGSGIDGSSDSDSGDERCVQIEDEGNDEGIRDAGAQRENESDSSDEEVGEFDDQLYQQHAFQHTSSWNRNFRYSVLTPLHSTDGGSSVGDDDEKRELGTEKEWEMMPVLSSSDEQTSRRYDSMSSNLRQEEARISSSWSGTRSAEKPGYPACAVIGPDYYTIGMVDILQTWTWYKRLERLWKVGILRRDPMGVSAAPPDMYAERFQRKMRELMLVPLERDIANDQPE